MALLVRQPVDLLCLYVKLGEHLVGLDRGQNDSLWQCASCVSEIQDLHRGKLRQQCHSTLPVE